MLKYLSLVIMLSLTFVMSAFAVEGEAVAQVPTWLSKITEIMGNLPTYLGLLTGLLTAILAIALVIPGQQPDKFLQGAVDILKKFSKK